MYKCFFFSTISPTLICCFFGNCHSDRCEVISHILLCISLIISGFWALLYVSVGHVCVPSSKHVCLGPLPFLNPIAWGFLILNYMSSLYILGIKPYWMLPFATIFSRSVDCLLLLVSCMLNILTFYIIGPRMWP